jgi:xanthine dehydrogenase D subunit
VGVGADARRVDGVEKVTGAFVYANDLTAPNMLVGVTVRSGQVHGRIASIDTGHAAALPGVRAVLTAADVPGAGRFGLLVADQPVLACERVRFVGEPVALVAAEDLATARAAAALVRVDCDRLPAVTDMAAAAAAPAIHPGGNVLRDVTIVHGEPGTAAADVWVEGSYETSRQDPAFLAPEAALALPDGDDVQVLAATQWLHSDRRQIAAVLGLPEDRVRLRLSGVGGAFGGREDVTLQAHACLLARATGRPVKMLYDRAESFVGHVHRHACRIWMRHGADRSGRLVCVHARLLFDGGAYASSSPAVIANACSLATGPYRVPHARVAGQVVYTNNPPAGAMRGFGAPQVCLAYESQMDRLAAALGRDPVELRLDNAVRPGDTLPTGQVVEGPAPAAEVLRRCVAPRLLDVPLLPRCRRGVGVALGYKNLAYSEGFDDTAGVRLRVAAPRGRVRVDVESAAAEVGQGVSTILAQIVSEELGDVEIDLAAPDTTMPCAGSSSASRQTMMSGGAVRAACAQVRRRLADRLEACAGFGGGPVAAESLRLAHDQVLVDGRPVVAADRVLAAPVVAEAVNRHQRTAPLSAGGSAVHVAFAFTAQRAVVDVDERLATVRVIDVTAAHDVGLALNPRAVRGQIAGGTAQGIGWALTEQIRLEDGAITNASFTDYVLPTSLDMPPVRVELVEEPDERFPYGAKGVGELSTVVAGAAVVAAVRDATSRELARVPIRPEDLLELRLPDGP